jgi:hypothetical protein
VLLPLTSASVERLRLLLVVLEISAYVYDMFEGFFLSWNMQTCLQNIIGIRYTKQIPKNDINSYNKNDSKTLCKVNIKEYRKNIFCHVKEIEFFLCKNNGNG